MGKLGRYVLNVLVGVDQLANAVLGGDPDETISSRVGKWQRDKAKRSRWRRRLSYGLCLVLHLFDRDHCRRSIEDDEGRGGVIR